MIIASHFPSFVTVLVALGCCTCATSASNTVPHPAITKDKPPTSIANCGIGRFAGHAAPIDAPFSSESPTNSGDIFSVTMEPGDRLNVAVTLSPNVNFCHALMLPHAASEPKKTCVKFT